MPYCTLSDLKKQISEAQLIKLSDDLALGVIDQPTIDDAILAADAEIDSYLAGRYSVPLVPIPPLIKRCSVEMAIHTLYGRRRGATKEREERHKNTLRILKNLSTGTQTLGETPQRPQDQGGGPKATAPNRRITQGKGTTAGSLDNY